MKPIVDRRGFLLGAAALAGCTATNSGRGDPDRSSDAIVLSGPGLEFRPNVIGAFDLWLKWGDFDGDEDARFEVEHVGGVAGYSLNQSHNPGWHFLGAYHLDRASRVLATNRSAYRQPNLRKPVGAEALKLVPRASRVVEVEASELVTVVELDVGDELRFVCRDGRKRSLRLVGTAAKPTKIEGLAITEYAFTQDFEIDGVARSFVRTVPSTEFMGEPISCDGLLLWPDSVQDVFVDCGGFEVEKDYRHVAGTCRPMRRARLLVQDAAIGRVCPEKCHWWYPERFWPIVPEQCYMGRDCWMGTWYGSRTFPSPRGNEAHCGIDVNMPASTPLRTPFALDEQHYFHSLKKGANNNRWRGIRKWNATERWWIQSHHIDIPYVVPEGGPLAANVLYAKSGGQWAGEFCHTHFNLRVFRYGLDLDGQPTEESFWVNPGVLFWQMQRDFPLPKRPESVDVAERLSCAAMESLQVVFAGGSEGKVLTTKRGALAFFKLLPKRMFDIGIDLSAPGWTVESSECDGALAGGTMTRDGSRVAFAVRVNASRRYMRASAGAVFYAPTYDLANGAPLHVKVGFGESFEEALKMVDSVDWCYERVNLGKLIE